MTDNDYVMMKDIIGRQGARIAQLEAQLQETEVWMTVLAAAALEELIERLKPTGDNT